jgi:hypothetical protein
MICVEYHFSDGDTTRAERDEVDVTWEITAPVKITVEYIPGRRGASRLKGNTAVFSHGLSVVCGLGLAGVAFVRYRELRQGKQAAPGRTDD